MSNPELDQLGLSYADLEKQHAIEAKEKALAEKQKALKQAEEELAAAKAAEDNERYEKALRAWEEYKEQCVNDAKEIVYGYDTLPTILNKWVASAIKLEKYLRKRLPVESLIASVASLMMKYLIISPLDALGNVFKSRYQDIKIPKDLQPSFYFDIKMNDENQINLKNMVFGRDAHTITPAQRQEFETFVRSYWIPQFPNQDYSYSIETVASNPGLYQVFKTPNSGGNREVVSKQEFQAMLQDKDHGLVAELVKIYGNRIEFRLDESPEVERRPNPAS